MKKLLKVLIVILLITMCGCSNNKQESVKIDEQELVVDVENSYDFVIVDCSPKIKLYYDKDLKVVEVVELDDNATQTWSDLNLVGKKLSEAVNLLLSQAKEKEVITDNQVKISLSAEDVEAEQVLTETVNKYVDENKDVQVIVNETTVSGEEKVVVETPEPITENSYIGIWEMESWTNPSYWAGYAAPRVIVFLKDGIGFETTYDKEDRLDWPSTFNWTETDLSYTHGGSIFFVDNGIVNNHATIKLEDGQLIQTLSENEIVTYHKVESYEPPVFNPNCSYILFNDLMTDYNNVVSDLSSYGY